MKMLKGVVAEEIIKSSVLSVVVPVIIIAILIFIVIAVLYSYGQGFNVGIQKFW